MFEILSNFFKKTGIDYFGILPLNACILQKPYLLEHVGIADGSVIVMAIPYCSRAALSDERNISAYAVSRDYHLFFRLLFDELLPILQTAYPTESFVGFADHSPINEVHAAAQAGLGVIGTNGLLLTEKYSSYVFLGEIITTLTLPSQQESIRTCENCGACRAACPCTDGEECLSALTQKKGSLSREEEDRILHGGSAWGCDRCQEVCPYTARAIANGTILSPIPFFSEQPIPKLTQSELSRMSDEAFAQRAYAWRKRETVERNLSILEKGDPSC